jgi:hypothetical protein
VNMKKVTRYIVISLSWVSQAILCHRRLDL